VFSAVFERILVSLESELQNVYRTNSLYLNDTEYFVTIDANETDVPRNCCQRVYGEFSGESRCGPRSAYSPGAVGHTGRRLCCFEGQSDTSAEPGVYAERDRPLPGGFGLENIDEILPSEQQVIELMALQASLAKKKRVYGCESVRESETGPLSRPKLTHNFGD
jgi:hypothetical protein